MVEGSCVEASCGVAGAGAGDEVAGLLADAGFERRPGPPARDGDGPALPGECAVLQWAASGAMTLTGHPDGPPLAPPGPVLARAQAVVRALAEATAAIGRRVPVDLGETLSGRAALAGLGRQGRSAPSRSCRLLRSADGWLAVNLARPDDVASVPAVVEAGTDGGGDPWDELARWAQRGPATAGAERCQLLGVPAAALGVPGATGLRPLSAHGVGRPRRQTPERLGPGLVVDLSAMWAGPLCARLLGQAGLRVVKLESRQRPDGARTGPPAFFDWLHAGHESVVVDLDTPGGRRALRRLVERADVVVEASRRRALEQLGLDAEELVAARPGRTWVSVTGYGRQDLGADRVAFGDDAAVAGGLVAWDADGAPVFAGDAIADPLAGLCAALGAVTSLVQGGGHLVEVAMAGVARWCAAPGPDPSPHTVTGRGDAWTVRCGDREQPVASPRRPDPAASAEPSGRSTRRVLAELDKAERVAGVNEAVGDDRPSE